MRCLFLSLCCTPAVGLRSQEVRPVSGGVEEEEEAQTPLGELLSEVKEVQEQEQELEEQEEGMLQDHHHLHMRLFCRVQV